MENQRTPTAESFGRSPLTESSLAGSRRPSATDISGRTAGPRDPYGNGDGIGRGPPPNQRRPSEERPEQNDKRKGSAASEYAQEPPPRMTAMKPSSETMKPIPEAEPSDRRSTDSERERRIGMPEKREIPPFKANGSKAYESKPQPSLVPQTQPQTQQLAPTITTTLPSPSIPQEPTFSSTTTSKPNRRASFHPPPLNTAFSRDVLLSSRTGVLPGVAGLTVGEGKGTEGAIMDNVEEMLDSFDWTAGTGIGENGRKKGSADAIEGRLLDELTALDSVSNVS